LNKLLPLIVFSVLLLIPAGAQNAFAQQSGADNTAQSSQPDTFAPSLANPEDIVYENGVAGGDGNSLFIHRNSIAADFVLDDPTSITDVHFILVERNDPDSIYNNEPIEYAILGDNNGPDSSNVLGRGNAINIEIMNLGPSPVFHNDRLLVWFDLEEPVPVDANVRYWLWLHVGDDFNVPPSFGWELVTPRVEIDECPRFYPRNDFTGQLIIECDDDLWFQLTDKKRVVGGELLPIDSTALLLAGIQSSAIWMLPVLAGVAGSAFAVLYIKSRRN